MLLEYKSVSAPYGYRHTEVLRRQHLLPSDLSETVASWRSQVLAKDIDDEQSKASSFSHE